MKAYGLGTLVSRASASPRLYWLPIPLLAIAAYCTVLRNGFYADDFVLLNLSRAPGIDFRFFVPGSDWLFYRPAGDLLIWELGWHLWGFNPLPYHALGLLLHAATSLALGLVLARITGRRGTAWFAAALFAVYPLHVEAVGWAAAFWDSLSTLFLLLSLGLFTTWWRDARRPVRVYIVAVLFFGLALYTKESIFGMLATFVAAAWFVKPPHARRDWRSLFYSLVPFGGLVMLNVGSRLLVWGELGSYPGARVDYLNFIWDALAGYLRFLLAPLNPAVVDPAWIQVVSLASGILALVGLTLFGHAHRRLLLLLLIWFLAAIFPVLNLSGINPEAMQNNRFLYLPATAYCGFIALMSTEAISSLKRLGRAGPALEALATVVVLFGGIVACWLQIAPWNRASAQITETVSTLLRVVPIKAGPAGVVWFIQDPPVHYKGAHLLYSGLGLSRILTRPDATRPAITRVEDATATPFVEEKRDVFAVRFRPANTGDLRLVDYVAGITTGTDIPASGTDDGGTGLVAWDFRACAPGVVGEWQARNAHATCTPGEGLTLEPASSAPGLVGPVVNLELAKTDAQFVRLRLSARYEPTASPERQRVSWLWRGTSYDFGGKEAATIPVRQDGVSHVYWTYIQPSEIGPALAQLRFNPIDAQIRSRIEWIALDVVK